VSPPSGLRRAGSGLGSWLLVPGLVLGLWAGSGPPGPAHADPPDLTSARARAAALQTRVARTEVAVETAVEEYDRVRDGLSSAVADQLRAQRQLGLARQQRREASAEVTNRVRAFYMTGGPAGLYASVMQGRSFGDVLSRVEGVRTLVVVGSESVDRGRTRTRAAARRATHLQRVTERHARLEGEAARAADRVTRLLTDRRQLLAGADAQVRRLLAEEQRRQRAEAARRAAEALAAAQRAASRQTWTEPTSSTAAGPYAPRAVAEALRMRGRPYQWGATGPDTFDCSGLTGWAYRAAGLSLPRTSRQQWYAGSHVGLAALAPGDLLFWATDTQDPATIHHVAMYLGRGQMVEAPHTGAVVRVSTFYLDGYVGAVRPGA